MQTLKTINAIDHIRTHREMYFPDGKVSPRTLARRLVDDALILGATRCGCLNRDDWWLVWADKDWLDVSPDGGLLALFSKIVPLPEAGVNAMRSEILLTAFADDVLVSEGHDLTVVHTRVNGEAAIKDFERAFGPLSLDPWVSHLDHRLVAFRLAGNA
jgi:hypothetical protein